MIDLSNKTMLLIDALFGTEDRERIKARILDEVSTNIPYCDESSPEEMERIRFSVIRLLHEKRMSENDIFELAYKDWRDLFMAAAHDELDSHSKWAETILK